jgi:choline dehydrogenase-like flavoprotein
MARDRADSEADHRLRVRGIDGLRVIDASIFLAVTSGNTNAPPMPVGDKGADLVLADNLCLSLCKVASRHAILRCSAGGRFLMRAMALSIRRS